MFIHHADIFENTVRPYTYDDCPSYRTVVVFDCRGVEPTQYDPRVWILSLSFCYDIIEMINQSNDIFIFVKGGWSAIGLESGIKFDVNLSQDWADFDEKQKESVGIYEIKYKFVRL